MSAESDNKKDKDLDVFIANTIYPEAEPIFTARLKSLEEIKSDCLVVLDTNALLVPYTTSKESLEQIRRTYTGLAAEHRLIIPGQVAREFAKNRANKIGELYQQLSAKRDSAPAIQKGAYPLLESVEEYQKSLRLEDDINRLLREYRETVGRVLEHVRGWTWDDPVSLLYGELFTGGIVMEANLNQEEVKKEHVRRKLHTIPPGYKDSGVGDLVIWFTILEIGRANKKSLIFVSGDEKPDWYHISNKQPLYPRFELVDEYRRASDGQSFHIIQFSKFLGLYGASESVVEEVRQEERQIRLETSEPTDVQLTLDDFMMENAVFQWLQRQHPNKVRHAGAGGDVDYIVEIAEGASTGVEVKGFRILRGHIKGRLREAAYKLMRAVEARKYTDALLVLVATNSRILARLNDYIDELDTPGVTITVGLMNESLEFTAIRSTTDII